MGDVHTLIRTLREFAVEGKVAKKVRDELRAPVPAVRRRIKDTAIATLPGSGGLGAWVAGTKITAQVTLRGRAAGIRLRGGRRSQGGVTDTRAIDRGRVRAPSWGRRGRSQWHTQSVTPGFFTRTAAEAPEWLPAIERGVAAAMGEIHA